MLREPKGYAEGVVSPRLESPGYGSGVPDSLAPGGVGSPPRLESLGYGLGATAGR